MPRSDCILTGKRPVSGENISPFVHFGLQKSSGFREGEWISVGNISTSKKLGGEAVIKSFEFGASDGVTATIEILDERGGAFDASVRAMTSSMELESSMAAFWWGWIVTDCATGSSRMEKAGPVYLNLIDMNVTFSGGKVKYKINCKDAAGIAKDITGEDNIWGDEKNPMKIKDGLKKMMESKSCNYCGKDMGMHDSRAVVCCEKCLHDACNMPRERLAKLHAELKEKQCSNQ